MSQYKTIQTATEVVFKEQNSKFLAFAYPVSSETAVKKHIELLKKKYFDASHVCYAFMLGAERTHYRACDAGEPNGTAGLPILGQIRSFEVTNVLVVVVRYFGGTKLGVSGLIEAYKQAAALALSKAVIITEFVTIPMQVVVPYQQVNEVMKIIKEQPIKVVSQVFEIECSFALLVRKANFEVISLKMRQIAGAVISY
jgi:uncharacterized YigZ family protein